MFSDITAPRLGAALGFHEPEALMNSVDEIPYLVAIAPTTGTADDDDEPEDEDEDENEAPVRETNDRTEAPEEFEKDDEDPE